MRLQSVLTSLVGAILQVCPWRAVTTMFKSLYDKIVSQISAEDIAADVANAKVVICDLV